MKKCPIFICLMLAANPFELGAVGNCYSNQPHSEVYGFCDRHNQIQSLKLQLPIVELRKYFDPHVSYCGRHPEHCDLSGPGIIEFNQESSRLLQVVNTDTNQFVKEASDKVLHDREEYWAFPSEGAGDCEDVAIFKREQLVGLGLPRGAMTIAIVHHRSKLFPHAVLLVETTAGTYLLDNLQDELMLWYDSPYNFESRERPDGSWERYDQNIWIYELE